MYRVIDTPSNARGSLSTAPILREAAGCEATQFLATARPLGYAGTATKRLSNSPRLFTPYSL